MPHKELLQILIAIVDAHLLKTVENKEIAKMVADILMVKQDQLEKALCTRSTVTQGETIISPTSSATAVNVRDAFVKGVYGRLFVYIVTKINEAIYKPSVSALQNFTIHITD